MALLYKTLFEVKLMHEFYLTLQDGRTPFAFTDQRDRMEFLMDGFSADRLSINEDLGYEFPEILKSEYNNYGLKLIDSYSGFRIVIAVNAIVAEDQSVMYKPRHELPNGLSIVVLLQRKNNIIDRYSNSNLNTTIPSAYFFSNEEFIEPKKAPFLTEILAPYSSDKAYEQGQLALFGNDDIRAYYKEIAADKWEPVAGTGFASENDRILVPPVFKYSFPVSTSITRARFILKNIEHESLKTITVEESIPVKNVQLNFSTVSGLFSLPPHAPVKDKLFILEVTGNGNYSKKYNLVFGGGIYNPSVWGIVCMKAGKGTKAFDLFDAAGFLINRADSGGNLKQAPVFEIPVKSRYVYWRYVNNKGKELKLLYGDELADYLLKDGKALVTKKPRAMALSWLLLQKDGSSETKFVPNPRGYELQRDTSGRLCLNIRVPQSELFPVT